MRKYIDINKEAIKQSLNAQETVSKKIKGKDTSGISVSVLQRLSAFVVRIKQHNSVNNSLVISVEFINALKKKHGSNRAVFYSNCPKHGWGVFLIDKYYRDEVYGKFVYKLVCKKCLAEEAEKSNTKKVNKGIFHKLFRVFKRGEKSHDE